jgi:hypothetical protein
MTDPVTLHDLYYTVDTRAWLDQRTGAHHVEHSRQLADFADCGVFDDYWPRMDITARMKLWCAAHGWPVADDSSIEIDDQAMTRPASIVLTVTTDLPRQALALVNIDGTTPEVFTDVTTDEGYWLTGATIQITCPDGHAWTWDGDRDLHTDRGDSVRIRDLFGPHGTVISRCRECVAFDDGDTDVMCPCPGHAVYCPTCGQRCAVTLPDVPTHEVG